MRKVYSVVTVIVALLVLPALSRGADIVGSVSDSQNKPVGGIQVSARTLAGKSVRQTITDGSGKYWLVGLDPGTYNYVLDPLQTRFRGGNAVSQLDAKGLTLNWKVSLRADAIAAASPGSSDLAFAGDPFGLSAGQFAGLVLGGGSLAAGGVVGAVDAAGGFSSSSPKPIVPVSPAR